MTKIVIAPDGSKIIHIEPEESAICDFCGKKEELRPYGPNGERICFSCGEANEPTTTQMMKKIFFGE